MSFYNFQYTSKKSEAKDFFKNNKKENSMLYAFMLVIALPAIVSSNISYVDTDYITESTIDSAQNTNLHSPIIIDEDSKKATEESNKDIKVTNSDRDKLIKFVTLKNKHLPAGEFVDSCLKTKLNCRLAIAMTGQESGFCKVYRLYKNGSWKNYNYSEIQDIQNKVTGGYIKYNCSGVKTYRGKGGNMQSLSDGFKGSIVGYESFESYFKHKEEIAIKRYSAMLSDSVTLSSIQAISYSYVGGAGIDENWSKAVYNFYQSIS